jgi:hypothetical protein
LKSHKTVIDISQLTRILYRHLLHIGALQNSPGAGLKPSAHGFSGRSTYFRLKDAECERHFRNGKSPGTDPGLLDLQLLSRMLEKIEFGAGLNIFRAAGFHCPVGVGVKLAALERAIGGVVRLLRRLLVDVCRKGRAGERRHGNGGQGQLRVQRFH